MNRVTTLLLVLWLGATAAATTARPSRQAARPLRQSAAVPPSNAPPRALFDQYCIGCHNGRVRAGGLQLDTADLTDIGAGAAVWEKVVRKLRTGMMPPAGMPRPDEASAAQTAAWLEGQLDRQTASHPNPGRPAIHRLNRTEYVNAIRDLFGIELDGRTLLPGDNSDAHGFDNNADILSVSPVLMDRYLSAARKISSLVVGRPAAPDFEQFRVHKWLSQDDRMSEELPFGSRGGTAVPYFFPADGDYVVKVLLHRTTNDHIKGLGAEHLLEIRVDGALVKRFTVGGDQWVKLAPPENYSSNIKMSTEWEDYSHNMDRGLEVRVPVKAGRRVVGVSFVGNTWEPEGIIQPQAGVSLNRNEVPDGNPQVASVAIGGPFDATGPGHTIDRRKVFICEPAGRAGEEPCARKILATLARRAYRRPVSAQDVKTLLTFYATGREEGSFDAGIQFALERLLVSPEFLFRLEQDRSPAEVAPYRISDVELASRLSFFLWSSIPDDELLDAAARGQLNNPAVLTREVKRMLADDRSRALVDNFVGQWLVVRNLRDVVPDSDLYPEFDENLRAAFEQETELFMASMLHDDRPIPEVLTADYTFVNERLARHYGIAGVYGSQFRRVPVTDSRRIGLLGQGSILTVTSYANRTSPVLRGKWLLENFLGTPPAPPPPDIPPLPDNPSTRAPVSVRARLEAHRKNAACATCHAQMDPLGFALENFDAIGGWRSTEAGRAPLGVAVPPGGIPPQPPIDAKATLADGTSFEGPAGLRRVLVNKRAQFVQTVTEKLLTYALGRELEYYDAPAVRQILRDAAVNDMRWSAVILDIVRSAPFQMRRSES